MDRSRRGLLMATTAAVAGIAGCAGANRSGSTSTSTATISTDSAPPNPGTDYAYTHLQASGNRVLNGAGDIARTDPVDIAVDGTPAWLLAFPPGAGSEGDGQASLWTIVTEAGRATTHRVAAGSTEQVAAHDTAWSPPVGALAEGTVGLVDPPADCSERTHPVPVDDGWLYVTADGDAVIRRETGTARFEVAAPDDVRIVALGDDRYALYGRKTGRYTHGALGDTVEGSSLVVIDAGDERVETETRLDARTVFEGLSPIVADLDGDGTNELVTTVADSSQGARIRVYGTDGTEVATGPVYGPGWRHQLCVAPFAPDGTPELAVVRKPHVDRTVEFYRLDGGELTVTATHEGFASHTYASRNLDGGLAADLDSDGTPELLVPTTDRETLAAVPRTSDGAETAWDLSLAGALATNVAGVALDDGRVAVGAGTLDGVRIWQG
jgi:hypothetical protein